MLTVALTALLLLRLLLAGATALGPAEGKKPHIVMHLVGAQLSRLRLPPATHLSPSLPLPSPAVLLVVNKLLAFRFLP